LRPLRQHPSRSAVLSPGRPHSAQGYNAPREEPHSQGLCPAARTDAGLSAAKCTGENTRVIDCAQVWSQALRFQQFHVLFDSLSKVLFIFRSLYLCAIGLWPVFSFRWNLPPILSCIPKQLDSSKALHMSLGTRSHTGFSPSVTSCSKELRPDRARSILYKLQLGPWGQISNLSCCRFTRRY
jgi:hypothetical protein